MRAGLFYWLLLKLTNRNPLYFDGQSLPSLIKAVRQSKLTGAKEQTPIYRYPTPDKARLRAKECVRRFMKIMRRTA